MENVVIISETQGFLISTLQEHMEAANCAVSVVGASVDKISKVPHPVDVALIYASEELLEDQQVLIYIRDRSVEEGTAIFLVGSEGEVEEIEKSDSQKHDARGLFPPDQCQLGGTGADGLYPRTASGKP